jgi:predicted neuraminidase
VQLDNDAKRYPDGIERSVWNERAGIITIRCHALSSAADNIENMRSSTSSFLFFSLIIIVGIGVLLRPHTSLSYPAAALSSASLPIGASEASPSTRKLVLKAKGKIPMPAGVPSAHASSLVPLSEKHPGTLAAFWFAGERESGPDVQIAFSWFDRETEQWTPAKFVVNRHVLAQQIGYGVRRLGNPVAWLDSSNRLHLFVVGTGLGGWAASRIIHLVQDGDLHDLHNFRLVPRGTIPLSWFWNTSYLVRSAPLPLITGGMVLPIHFELGIKSSVLAWFSEEGEFMGTRQITSRRNLLQPSVVAMTGSHWFAFMRMQGGDQRIARAESLDAGRTWQDLPDLDRPNPDAAVAALAIGGGMLVMAENPSSGSRHSLVLSRSEDGISWDTVRVLEEGQLGDEYSYPSLAMADGSLWVSYTDQRKRIAWQRFAVPSSSSEN